MFNYNALLLWVSLISGYPIPDKAPLPTITEEYITLNTGCDGEWAAYTDLVDGHIVLNKRTWKYNSSIDKTCILAHEFTHYLQFLNHQTTGLLEPPAYKVTEACYLNYGDRANAEWARKEIKRHEIDCKR